MMFKFEKCSDKFLFQDVIIYDNEAVFTINEVDDGILVKDINDLNNFVVVEYAHFKQFGDFLNKNAAIYQYNKHLNLNNFYI